MTIYGVALLAACTLVGVFVGDLLGYWLHVKANVGGVGIAMLLLMVIRIGLGNRGLLKTVEFGIGFWATMYIPIVVAMAAQQDVRAALQSGPMVVVAVVLTVGTCGAIVALFSALDKNKADADFETADTNEFQATLQDAGQKASLAQKQAGRLP